MRDSITLLSDITASDGAELTFQRVRQRISAAAKSIRIHMFVWRSDEIGNALGREVLNAADRGVDVHIKKDLGAFMYERIEMNRKSFFNKSIPLSTRLMYKIRARFIPDTFVEDDYGFELGEQLMQHPHVTMEWVDQTHTKYYLFDDRHLITGSINIEDRHRGYRDYMVEISGKNNIARFHERHSNSVAYDHSRSLDFVLNHVINGTKRFEIKPLTLELLSQAKRRVYIEMAYIGDPDVSRKLIETSLRGVQVTMLFSKEANIGNDINYHALCHLYKNGMIAVYLSGKMIHSKLMLIDDEIVILGSANTSVFSMQKAVELDVVVQRNPEFVASVRTTIEQRLREGRKVESLDELSHYSRLNAALQQLHQLLH